MLKAGFILFVEPTTLGSSPTVTGRGMTSGKAELQHEPFILEIQCYTCKSNYNTEQTDLLFCIFCTLYLS